MSRDLLKLQMDVGLWQQRAFGDGDGRVAGTAEHLEREVFELKGALHDSSWRWSEKAEEELADVVILAIGIAHRLGVDIGKAVESKMGVNYARRWHPPDEKGVCQHVEAGEEEASAKARESTA